MFKKYAILSLVAWVVAWVALMALCQFISERDPALGMHIWNGGQYILCIPLLVLGKAAAALIMVFSRTPGMIDATGDNYAIDNLFTNLFLFGVAILAMVIGWRMLKKVIGGGGAKAHH